LEGDLNMLGVIILVILLVCEIGFQVYCRKTNSYQEEKKNIVWLSIFGLFLILTLTHVIWWSFRIYVLFLILFFKAGKAIFYFIFKNKRKEKIYKKRHVIIPILGSVVFYTFAVIPVILFPQFKPIEITGDKKIETVSYTLTDMNRYETFSDMKENRKVTIQFWYPAEENETYPLVVFSHGAFGFRGSNASTFESLASSGYVVCSIDHTYHSFFTKQVDGKMVIANMDFINDAMAAQNGVYDDEKTYELSHEWLKLRADDMNFVLDNIKNQVVNSASDELFKKINIDKIGVFGHSLGGATSAEIGRERRDIDAVIVLDGTMFGEESSFENGKALLNTTPYPVPMLNIYNEEHYTQAKELGDAYSNMLATKNGVDAKQVVIDNAGHLNFTDLPAFSPFLAKLLGTGSVNSRYCIETTNQIIVDYFNHYLKGIKELNLQEEY
jgi:dienelactone hydrolase